MGKQTNIYMWPFKPTGKFHNPSLYPATHAYTPISFFIIPISTIIALSFKNGFCPFFPMRKNWRLLPPCTKTNSVMKKSSTDANTWAKLRHRECCRSDGCGSHIWVYHLFTQPSSLIGVTFRGTRALSATPEAALPSTIMSDFENPSAWESDWVRSYWGTNCKTRRRVWGRLFRIISL